MLLAWWEAMMAAAMQLGADELRVEMSAGNGGDHGDD